MGGLLLHQTEECLEILANDLVEDRMLRFMALVGELAQGLRLAHIELGCARRASVVTTNLRMAHVIAWAAPDGQAWRFGQLPL